MSKSISEEEGFKELVRSQEDKKYQSWNKSRGQATLEEQLTPFTAKLYKAVVLRQKETRESVRKIHSSERSRVVTLRNKTVDKGGVKSQWFYDYGLQTWEDIFSDWKEPGTTHELIVRYFNQLFEDFIDILNTDGVDTAKVYALYDRLFLELMDYFIGKTDKVPAVVKRKDLEEVIHNYDRRRNEEPKPVKPKPAPPPPAEKPVGRWKQAVMLKDKYGFTKGEAVVMDRETKTLYKYYDDLDLFQNSDDKWYDSALDERTLESIPNLDKPVEKPDIEGMEKIKKAELERFEKITKDKAKYEEEKLKQYRN
jgi:hypothetical protein